MDNQTIVNFINQLNLNENNSFIYDGNRTPPRSPSKLIPKCPNAPIKPKKFTKFRLGKFQPRILFLDDNDRILNNNNMNSNNTSILFRPIEPVSDQPSVILTPPKSPKITSASSSPSSSPKINITRSLRV
ncbi:ARID/BRIGHT DNA binding domain-containing protein [Tieghemostelium lacteum]|uniref:ARID/BRIGHT DNA binding domain-containing protein n=1 Tax=Tieghemostelium lacteum TaxID=361077 RepID=A0A152A8S6_TIELA|nr:ARID/BRIGHT DNA binding domain-containing protein [Tieghemostelium lacteum]|eukprot:KYR02622.1 ARID/BRIGHT DNA binding domain-containing protein [Tieghemostelium lacteum]